LTAITCVVAETPGKVSRIEPLNTEIVREQLAVLFRNFPIAAAKTGLHAIGYAKFYSRSHNAVIRVYDEAGNMLEAHEHAGEFKEW